MLLCETLFQTNQYSKNQQDWEAHMSRGRRNTGGGGEPCSQASPRNNAKAHKTRVKPRVLSGGLPHPPGVTYKETGSQR